MEQIRYGDYKLKKAVKKLNILDNSLNKRILEYLMDFKTFGRHGYEMQLHFRSHQSAISAALNDLKSIGVVESERDGKFIVWKIVESEIEKINNIVKNFISLNY